jgi:hypothetical protein
MRSNRKPRNKSVVIIIVKGIANIAYYVSGNFYYKGEIVPPKIIDGWAKFTAPKFEVQG